MIIKQRTIVLPISCFDSFKFITYLIIKEGKEIRTTFFDVLA